MLYPTNNEISCVLQFIYMYSPMVGTSVHSAISRPSPGGWQ